jgi:hypothetical protein
MRIKLINTTRYRDDDLRAFLRAGFAAFGSTADRKVVTVRYLRLGGRAGRGTLGVPGREARCIWLCPSREAFDVPWMAHVLHHEWLHNKGARHRDMTDEQMWWTSKQCAAWAVGLVVRAKEQPAPVPRVARLAEVVEKRAEHARKKLAAAARKRKLAQTVERRWRKRVRYYDAKLAARASARPPEQS